MRFNNSGLGASSQVTDEECLEVAAALKQQRRQQPKKSIARSKPLSEVPGTSSLSRPVSISDTASADEQRLQACQKMLEALPQSSAYVRHRKRVLQTAMRLLHLG